MKKCISVFLVIMGLLLFCWAAIAQGLPGAPSSREIQGRQPIPHLIPGKNNRERWNLIATASPKLIGMNMVQVEHLFGKSVSASENTLLYQVTEPEKGSKKGSKLAFVELEIAFANDSVISYTFVGIFH